MITARQKILNYIIEQQSSTVEELSKFFQVTPANIRHHLSILTRQGVVEVISTKTRTSRGRPAQVYTTRQRSDQNNLVQLSDALLWSLSQYTLTNGSRHVIKDLAHRLTEKISINYFNPTKRLYAAIKYLNNMNYLAHWEAHVEHPRIMFGHCPYRSILNKHPELCEMDQFLLEILTGGHCVQAEMLAINHKGLPQCVFLISYPA